MPHFLTTTLYNFYTPCIFMFILAYMTMEYKLSTIYNFMGMKCTHYKLCPIESKLVYFSQFRGMRALIIEHALKFPTQNADLH